MLLEDVNKFCNNLTQGIIIISKDYEILHYNNTFKEIFNCNGGIGEKCYKFFRNFDSPCENCPISEGKLDEFFYKFFKNKRIEYKVRKVDDEHFLIECFSFDDILKIFRKKIEELKFTEIGHIAASIAHKVNNILMTVSGRVETIGFFREAGKLTDEYFKKALSSIDEGLNSIKELMRELLNFAHPERLTKKKLDINQLLKEFFIFARYEIERGGVNFQLALGKERLECEIEERLFTQAILTLLRTLSKSFPEGAKEKRIVIETERKDGKVRVIIKDNNPVEVKSLKEIIEGLTRLTYENLVVRYAILFHEAEIEFRYSNGNEILIELGKWQKL